MATRPGIAPVSTAHAAFSAELSQYGWSPHLYIKVVRVGIHLVPEDAIRGSARCIADDEHAPAGNIDPDGISLADGSFGDRLACPAARSSPVLSAHRGRLQRFTGIPCRPGLPGLPQG